MGLWLGCMARVGAKVGARAGAKGESEDEGEGERERERGGERERTGEGGYTARLVKDSPQPLRRATAQAADATREEGVVDGEGRRLDGRSLEPVSLELAHTPGHTGL